MEVITKQFFFSISLIGVLVSVNHISLSQCQDLNTADEGNVKDEDVQGGEMDLENVEEFIPTDEWQTVKPGQAIPAGLHVRLDMQSGEREAKLMEGQNGKNLENPVKTDVSVIPEEDEEVNEDRRMLRLKKTMEDAMKDLRDESKTGEEGEAVYWNDDDREGMMNMFKDSWTQEELKEALKKYKAEKDDVQDEALRMEDIKKKFRPIEELRQEMKDLNFDVKTDFEVINELYEDYKKDDLSIEEHLRILADLEYYVHQIDNAVNCIDIGLMALVVKDLNHTDTDMRGAAAFLIGSAAQSNPKVQVHIIETGAMNQLIRMLSVETNAKVQNRVMYAVSSLVRQFPFAQLRFLQLGGLHAMKDLCVLTNSEKVKVKIVTLVGDLLHEQNSLVTLPDVVAKDKTLRERIRQYKRVPLFEVLDDQGWCELVPSLLYLTDHDQREKVLSTMSELLHQQMCQAEFTNVQTKLNELFKQYNVLVTKEVSRATDPTEESYFVRFIELILDIRKRLEYLDDVQRDEL